MNLKQQIANELKRQYSRETMMGSCKSIVTPRFFQIHLDPIIERQEAQAGAYRSDWSKLLSDVDLNRGILSEMIKAIWGIYNGTDINLVNIKTDSFVNKDCVMVWAASPDKKQLDKLGKLVESSLGDDYHIEVISGNHTDNRKVEKKIESLIHKLKIQRKKLVLICKFMGARSFSIPEIDSVFLWYDNGSIDSTSQRISRVFTNGETWDGVPKVYGNVVSFSFDPNRDESTPIDDYIISQAERVENDELNDSIKRVLNSVQMFTNDENGLLVQYDEVSNSEYVKKLINSSALLNVAEVSVNPHVLDLDDDDVFDVNLSKESKSKQKAVDRTKVQKHADSNEERAAKERREADEEEKSIRFRREVLRSVIRRIIDLTEINDVESDNFIEMLDSINAKALDDEVEIEVGVNTRIIKRWADAGAFPLKLLNTIITSYNEDQRSK